MRRLLCILATLIFIPSFAMAGPKEDALALLEKWADAFTRSDVDAIVRLYAKDALFMGTQTKGLGVDPAGVRKYFENALLNSGPRTAKLAASEVLVISENVVAVSGLDELTRIRDGATIKGTGRVTFVIAKRAGEWEIVQFHRSPVPQ